MKLWQQLRGSKNFLQDLNPDRLFGRQSGWPVRLFSSITIVGHLWYMNYRRGVVFVRRPNQEPPKLPRAAEE